jgi:hypothetical protein
VSGWPTTVLVYLVSYTLPRDEHMTAHPTSPQSPIVATEKPSEPRKARRWRNAKAKQDKSNKQRLGIKKSKKSNLLALHREASGLNSGLGESRKPSNQENRGSKTFQPGITKSKKSNHGAAGSHGNPKAKKTKKIKKTHRKIKKCWLRDKKIKNTPSARRSQGEAGSHGNPKNQEKQENQENT